jgi:uncharacterized protein YxjI
MFERKKRCICAFLYESKGIEPDRGVCCAQCCEAVFEISGKSFHIGDDLILVDSSTQRELIHIKRHVLSLMPLYEINRNERLLASVQKPFQLLGEDFMIVTGDGAILRVLGDILRRNFNISDEAGHLLAQISRQLSFPDSFTIDVAQGVDAPCMVALVIVTDMVKVHHESQHQERVVH